jgi:hypothetical protein
VSHTSYAGVGQRREGLLPLSTASALLLATTCGLLGAAVDTAFSNEVRDYFAAGFSIGTALAIWFVRPGHVMRTLVWIPLIYVVILFLAGAVHHPGQRYSDWLILAFVFKAPVIFITAATGIVTAIVRRLAGR